MTEVARKNESMPPKVPRRRRKGSQDLDKADLDEGENGVYRYGNGGIARFEGNLDEDGNRHGQGSYTWETGANYTGAWLQGVMHGTGVMTYSNGDTYAGSWENGVIHGHGQKRSLAHGSVEQGFYGPGGDTCVGPVQRDFDNGDSFCGHVTHGGVRQGYGEYIWADGYTYRGMWLGDRTHGVGSWGPSAGGPVSRFSSFVRSFNGTFVQEMRQGFGVAELWEDPLDPAAGDYSGPGCHYEGQWHQDLFHGAGHLRYRPFVARSFLSDLCRVEFDGEFKNGDREGVGVLQQVRLVQHEHEQEVSLTHSMLDVGVTDLDR